MKKQLTTYRVEGADGMGMFGVHFDKWYHYATRKIEAREIVDNFDKHVLPMEKEFEHVPLDHDLTEYYCAFKSLNHMLKIIPLYSLKYLQSCGLRIVEIKGEVVLGETQTIFKPENVKKRVVNLYTLEVKLAKKVAKKHLKKSLKVSDYLILN